MVPGAIRIAKEKALKKCQRANDIAAVTALLDDDDFVDDPDLQNSAGTILLSIHVTTLNTMAVYHK